MSKEDLVAYEVSEDRRLRELGIDPDGNIGDIYAKLVRLRDELFEREKNWCDTRD